MSNMISSGEIRVPYREKKQKICVRELVWNPHKYLLYHRRLRKISHEWIDRAPSWVHPLGSHQPAYTEFLFILVDARMMGHISSHVFGHKMYWTVMDNDEGQSTAQNALNTNVSCGTHTAFKKTLLCIIDLSLIKKRDISVKIFNIWTNA
ncbi:hypothetical protein Droror1_Dr00007526 [Drosera rotundifolia]